jgi:hypothetical protein
MLLLILMSMVPIQTPAVAVYLGANRPVNRSP